MTLGQNNWVTRRQHNLLSKLIGQQVINYHKQWLEWRLIIRVFDFVTVGKMIIIASEVGMFAKKARASCAAPAIFKNQKKHSKSS